MNTQPFSKDLLKESVIAVPPLARRDDFALNPDANRAIIRHLENGGVSTLLYGGNANLYHTRPSEYAAILELLNASASDNTFIIPAVGPAYGVFMDQAEVLKESDFPTAMVLPHQGMTTDNGVETGLRHFAEKVGKPIVVYIKNEGYLEPENVQRLVDDGLVSWIKYAIVREDPSVDAYLSRLVDLVDPSIIVSGIGEQPAIIHLRDFNITGFTSGCVCVNPALSMAVLRAIQSKDFAQAERIRAQFKDLEDLRNGINPIRVLHDAVDGAGIAETGPILPLFDNLTRDQYETVAKVATELRNIEG